MLKSTRIRLSLVLALVIGAILILYALLPRATPGNPATPTPRPSDLGAGLVTQRAFPSIGYGIQAFLWWNDALRPRDLELVRQMRFQYVKQIFGWRDIQPDSALPPTWSHADAVVDEANYRGVKLIARLGKPPDWAIRPAGHTADEPPFDAEAFGRFCGDLAARYRGKIAGYQVWNEPNLDREWLNRTPNAAAYVKVLAACHKAIKAADPAAAVITAGLAPTNTLSPQVIPDEQYLIEMYGAGAANHYDVLGLNAPGYLLPPETPPDDPRLDGQRWQVFRHVEDMRAIMVANGEGRKQVAVLEMGWTIDPRMTIPGADGTPQPNPYRWHAVSEAQQADFLVRAYAYAAQHWRPWVGLMLMIYIADPTWTPDNEEYWWAIVEPGYDLKMRQAFIDLANAPRSIDDTVIPPITNGINPYTPMPPRSK